MVNESEILADGGTPMGQWIMIKPIQPFGWVSQYHGDAKLVVTLNKALNAFKS